MSIFLELRLWDIVALSLAVSLSAVALATLIGLPLGILLALGRRSHMPAVRLFSAIVAALMLGKRRGFGKDPMPPHSLPLCLIGAGLLWTGWFGFNAGSALSASPLAGLAFLNTSTATSTAASSWSAAGAGWSRPWSGCATTRCW